MITLIFLIIAVSIDAMSFGFAQGIKNNKISIFYCLIMTILSTILFSIPLYISKFIVYYLNEKTLNIINGIVLIILGLFYLLNYFFNNKKINKKTEHNISLKYCIIETIPISLDAIFTAFLNGYTLNYLYVGIIFYFFITFIYIYIFNIIGLRISKKTSTNLSFLSSLIFIVIGILKLYGI